MKVDFYHMNKTTYSGTIQEQQSVKIKTLWYQVFKVLHDIDAKTLMVYIQNLNS